MPRPPSEALVIATTASSCCQRFGQPPLEALQLHRVRSPWQRAGRIRWASASASRRSSPTSSAASGCCSKDRFAPASSTCCSAGSAITCRSRASSSFTQLKEHPPHPGGEAWPKRLDEPGHAGFIKPLLELPQFSDNQIRTASPNFPQPSTEWAGSPPLGSPSNQLQPKQTIISGEIAGVRR